MTLLIGDHLGIDAPIIHQGRMSATHDSKFHPFQSHRLEPWPDVSPLHVVPADRCLRIFGREQPTFGPRSGEDESHSFRSCCSSSGMRQPNSLLCLRRVDIALGYTFPNFNVVVFDSSTPKTKNLTDTHTRKNAKFHNQPFSQIQNVDACLTSFSFIMGRFGCGHSRGTKSNIKLER